MTPEEPETDEQNQEQATVRVVKPTEIILQDVFRTQGQIPPPFQVTVELSSQKARGPWRACLIF